MMRGLPSRTKFVGLLYYGTVFVVILIGDRSIASVTVHYRLTHRGI